MSSRTNGRHARRKPRGASSKTGLILGGVAAIVVVGIAAITSMRNESRPPLKKQSARLAAPTPKTEPTSPVAPVTVEIAKAVTEPAPAPEPAPEAEHEPEAEAELTREAPPPPEPEVVPAKPARTPTATHEDTIGYWRFESDAHVGSTDTIPSESNAETMTGTVQGKDKGSTGPSTDVPGRFIYDPLTGKSSKNTASIKLMTGSNDGAYIEVPFDPEDGPAAGMSSFTLEMFVRPTKDPSRTMYAGIKSRGSDQYGEAAIGANFLSQWNQTYFAGFSTPPGGQPKWMSTGTYVSISRIHRDSIEWRHLAIVYDAEASTVTTYLDHWSKVVRKLDKPMKWDNGPIYIGGTPGGGAFAGQIDEVRLTKAALTSAEFLWARDDEISGVRFESVETVLPKGSGYYDLKEQFGAAGDGTTDDTAAIQKAFIDLSDKVPLEFNTLYIPPGTYLVSDTMRWRRFFVLQGAGQQRTIIKLKDNCPGFSNPHSKKSVIGASSTMGPGPEGQCNGSSMDNNAFDFTIDTGTGNPGAVAFEYHTNNYGTIQNITLRSGDGAGVTGLELLHNCVGPMLAKNITIEGFEYAIRMGYQEYSATFEHITMKNQKKAGVENAGNIMAFRGVKSLNSVPAFVGQGGNSMFTLIDMTLEGGSDANPAIKSEGSLYVRNLKTRGYNCAIEKRAGTQGENRKITWDAQTVDGPDVKEYVGDGAVCLRGEGKGSLKLPVEETPQVPIGDIHEDWIDVREFADRVRDGDWTPAVQAAIDSGKKTVYFPPGGYPCKGTVHLRGEVRRLRGMKTALSRPKDWNGSGPCLVFDNKSSRAVVVIDQLSVPGLRHASPGTLVLKNADWAPYTNERGCGKLFMENTTCNPMDFDHQKVWVRHWNPESHDTTRPCITSKGATIWSLGFKTEYESSKLWASGGAKTEIFGAFIYPIGHIPKDRPIFKNIDSEMAVQYGTSVYSSNHEVHIIDVQRGDEKRVGNGHLRWMGSRARMDLYTSHRFE